MSCLFDHTNFLTLSVSILSYLTEAPLALTVDVATVLAPPIFLLPPEPLGRITLFLILGVVSSTFFSFCHSCFRLALKQPEPRPIS